MKVKDIFSRIIIITFLIITTLALSLFLFEDNKEVEKSVVTIEIVPGTSVKEISFLLAENDVVSLPYLFYITTILWGVDKNIIAGEYRFETNLNYREVVQNLTKGPDAKIYQFIIPEGFTIEQIYKRLDEFEITDVNKFYQLAKNGAFDHDEYDFLKYNPLPSLEGYLFPKTYNLKENPEPEDIIEIFLKQFRKEINKLGVDVEGENNLNLHQIITIASLIEKEAKITEEREIISGVIYNRLQRNMPLQIDASVQYAMGKIKKLSNDDLNYPSPYNTYLYEGLPPGPICSPGIESIKAAFHPKQVDYLYYVLYDKEGHHKFTKTYQEFLEAKKDAKRRKVY
ncbi:MAG: endolytic transglycosylase MltG [Actinomycetia bacterium]|nr:endolytic transglycosylase MltG [Actinomycetes bacterium]